jgi:hypothetical protein
VTIPIVVIESLFSPLGELGFEQHIMTDYGDETSYKHPWQIFTRKDAEKSLDIARESVTIAKKVY